MKDNYYIYTEIIGCGKIGKIAIDSFHKYHNRKLHIYGSKNDFHWIKEHKNNVFMEVEPYIIDGFNEGHKGTALMWEKIIKNCAAPFLIHFDSDVIFRSDLINHMIDKSNEYDLIGPRRNYHHNVNNRNEVRHLTDVCQTCCILFNKKKISSWFYQTDKYYLKELIKAVLSLPFGIMIRQTKRLLITRMRSIGNKNNSFFSQMIQGTFSLTNFNAIDFFDPIMFNMIQNGARIYHLEHDEVGGCDYYGKRENAFKEINNLPTQYKIDYGSKLVHFSCVGSGMNLYKKNKKITNVSKTYIDCALDRYALFCKIFYNEDIGLIDPQNYNDILNIKEWY